MMMIDTIIRPQGVFGIDVEIVMWFGDLVFDFDVHFRLQELHLFLARPGLGTSSTNTVNEVLGIRK